MKLKTIMLVTGVLLTLALLSSWLGGPRGKSENADPRVGHPLLEADALRGVTAVEIEAAAGAPVRVELADGGWIVASEGGVPADLGRLRRILQPLANATVERFVTARPERKEGLDLQRHRLRLEGAEGAEILDLKIGRTASAGGVYVEPGADGRVYRLGESIALDATASNWIDRVLLAFAPEDVQAVKVGFPAEAAAAPVTFSLPTAEATWTADGAEEGATVRASDLNRLLRNLGSLRMTRQVDRTDPAAVEAAASSRKFEVTTFGGTTYALSFGRRPEGTLSEDETEAGEGAETPAPAPAGRPFVQLEFVGYEAGWAPVADRYAIEIAEWTFNQLPANPAALLTAPAPAPAATGE